ncbi:kinase-like protein [Penicillium brevicompactum]|uniref:Kinase-like protein n=1 Tax=Penicillium brevicompactum TaxID=5074 RepID=A0A9W9R779_PENBR|nr:kinase-like protein [Penicillium brevicompactum]
MATPEETHQASVIAYCQNPSPENVVSQYGKRVIRISDQEVVKWGPDVTNEEVENQRIAYELVDSRIVRIPRVHAFFSDERGWGYIVMEFIKGKAVDPLEDTDVIKKIAGVLDYFATLRHTTPGSLCGGFCRGLLFPDTEDLVFENPDEMEKWFNSRLFSHNPKLSLQRCDLILCHLGLAPRNILWQEDGSFCLIDWASAGYYPRLFEFCAQWIIEGKDGRFNSLLLESMNPLSSQELAQKESIMSAWRNFQGYSFQTKIVTPWQSESEEIIRVPPPPMPAYSSDWPGQAGQACFTPKSPPSMDSPSSAFDTREGN